jgi:hypothetical protein
MLWDRDSRHGPSIFIKNHDSLYIRSILRREPHPYQNIARSVQVNAGFDSSSLRTPSTREQAEKYFASSIGRTKPHDHSGDSIIDLPHLGYLVVSFVNILLMDIECIVPVE